MSVIQTMGAVAPVETDTVSPTLALIAQARLQSVDGDAAARAACIAAGLDPLTLDGLAASAEDTEQVKTNETAAEIIRLSAVAAKRLGLAAVDVTDATEMGEIAADAIKLADFCQDASNWARVCSNPVNAGTVKVVQAVNKSKSRLQDVFDAVTASGSGFSSSYAVYQDGVASLTQNVASYSRCLILVATGYWSSSGSQFSNVFLNGTQVSDGRLNNVYRPTSVTRANIGAITLPTASFTETGDAYAAVHVYTAD